MPEANIEVRTESPQGTSLETEVEIIAGRLKLYIDELENLHANKKVMSWINGYIIQFSSKSVQQKIPKKQNWSDKENQLMTKQINILLSKKAIQKCEDCDGQFLSSIFLTPKPDGSSRFILNLKKKYVHRNKTFQARGYKDCARSNATKLLHGNNRSPGGQLFNSYSKGIKEVFEI